MHASACRFFVVFGDNLFLCCNPPSFLFGTFAFCRHFIQYFSKKLARLKTDNFLCSNFYFSFAENNKKPLLSKKERFFVLIIEGIFLIDEEMDAVRAFVPSVVIKTIGIDHFAYNIFSRSEFFACYSG